MKYSFLKIFSKWTYLFTGINLINKDVDVDLIYISAYLGTSAEFNCINGLLSDFEVDTDDQLIEVVIYNVSVSRELFKNDSSLVISNSKGKSNVKNSDPVSKIPIDSDIFILNFSEVKFFSISYLSISDSDIEVKHPNA